MKNKQSNKKLYGVTHSPPAMHLLMSIDDPRIDRHKAHPPGTTLIIAICAVISGAESFVDMEDFGNARR